MDIHGIFTFMKTHKTSTIHVGKPWASTTIKIMVDPIPMIKTLR